MSTSGSNYREGYVKLLGDDKPTPVDVMSNPAIRALVNQAQLKGTKGQPLFGALHVAVITSKNRIQRRVLLLTASMIIVLYGMERGMLDGFGGPGQIARIIHLSQIKEVVVTGHQACKACLLDMLPVSNDPAFFFKVEDNEMRNGGITGGRQFVNNLVYLARFHCNNYNLAIRLADQNQIKRLSAKTMKPSGFLRPKAKLEQIRQAGGVRKFFPPKDRDKERELLDDIQRRRYGEPATQLPESAPPAYEPKAAAELPPPPAPPALPPPPPPDVAQPPTMDYGPAASEQDASLNRSAVTSSKPLESEFEDMDPAAETDYDDGDDDDNEPYAAPQHYYQPPPLQPRRPPAPAPHAVERDDAEDARRRRHEKRRQRRHTNSNLFWKDFVRQYNQLQHDSSSPERLESRRRILGGGDAYSFDEESVAYRPSGGSASVYTGVGGSGNSVAPSLTSSRLRSRLRPYNPAGAGALTPISPHIDATYYYDVEGQNEMLSQDQRFVHL